jgi:hypothetical protein
MRSLKRAALAAMALTGALIMSPAFADTPPKQGGAAVVTFKDDLATLDPAIGYDWQNWSIIKSIFSGLMDYKPGTTELMPDLAESYTISDDGLTYTFKLRPNLKFHNGRAVTSADVKYSIERAVNPKTQCPGAGYFSMIKGYDDEAAGKTTGLSASRRPIPSRSYSPCPRPMRPSSISCRSTASSSCRRMRWRNTALISAIIPSVPGPSNSANGSWARSSCWSATRTITAPAYPISTRSPSSSGRSPRWRCCG